MDQFDFQRIAKTENYEIMVHKTNNYMLLSYFGIWDEPSQLNFYLEDVENALKSLASGFNLIIDLRQYRGSISEYIHLHVKAQSMVIKAGLKRTAVVILDKPMLKLTVEYIFKQSGLNAVFFKNYASAQNWISLK